MRLHAAPVCDAGQTASSATPARRLIVTIHDITVLRQLEQERLRQALQQRDTLVREVHHRIKNNLQGVAGLMQQVAARRPEVQPIIAEVVGQDHLLGPDGALTRLLAAQAVQQMKPMALRVQVRSFEERSTKASTHAANAQACAFVELVPTEGGTERYGVGLDHNIVTACIQALISGVNRLGLVPTDEPADMAA